MSTGQKFYRWGKLIVILIFALATARFAFLSLNIESIKNINLNFATKTFNNYYFSEGSMKNDGNSPADGTLEIKSEGLNAIKSIDITAGKEYIKKEYKSLDGKYIYEFGLPPGGAIMVKTVSDNVTTATAVTDINEKPWYKKFFTWFKKLFGY